jgi:hypothetical protein
MFDKILEGNINIYASTAANSVESSWAYYCSPNDMVYGKHIGSCLGDEYSINWMEDTDSHDACKETLADQFTNVQTKTAESHAKEFGATTFKSEPIGNKDHATLKVHSNPSIRDLMLRLKNRLREPEVLTQDLLSLIIL